MAEQLRLDQRLRDRGTIYRHESSFHPAHFVNCMGEIFFAGACFPMNQHWQAGSAQPRGALLQSVNLRRVAAEPEQRGRQRRRNPSRFRRRFDCMSKQHMPVTRSQHPFMGRPTAHQRREIVDRRIEKARDRLANEEIRAAPVASCRLRQHPRRRMCHPGDSPGSVNRDPTLRVDVEKLG